MNKTIKLGLFRDEDRRPWECVKDLVSPHNIDLEIEVFCSKGVLSLALNSGLIDMYACHTKEDLEQENIEHGYALAALTPTYIEPMGLFSKKVKPGSELPSKSLLLLPEEPSELARALWILQSYDLIKTTKGLSSRTKISDIISNPLQLRFDTCDCEDAINKLDTKDVTAVFLHGHTAIRNDLNHGDCLYCEKELFNKDPDYPFMKVLAVRRVDLDDPGYSEIVKAFNTEATQAVLANLQYRI